ncbi:hypothetical protein BGP77_10495 [Saccharospirillum sp. MSK14-1]|uniref:SDR family NAD(P)-dependent oxidoreductase n=1 Tax=Saccharospirillum sp. MSK14-1 TaxID=1897632 RepID=UPI000D3B16B8|nr:SDR family NAD(P)-dependent oxidoreductase [Saccharospirillum sp. MSK14-1]PTY38605.1 hypothetical protein BGP77_10495 [Saccharospirillum sp. MSK14-1]
MLEQPAVTLITGAASGLGWALTQRYAELGHRLLLVDRDQQPLAERLEMVRQYWPDEDHQSLAKDLTDPGAADQIAHWVQSLSPHLTLLINNAGITHRSRAGQTQPDVFRQVMAVDYLAPVELTLALQGLLQAAPSHRDRGIVVIGSMAGWMPVLGRAGYCAAKAALHQFFETARAEAFIPAEQLTLVHPSFLATPITKNALGYDGQNAQHQRASIGTVRSADWMAERIIRAHRKRQRRYFPDRFSAWAAALYRLWPDLYLRLMQRRLASEFVEQPSSKWADHRRHSNS